MVENAVQINKRKGKRWMIGVVIPWLFLFLAHI
jgi:hypothetical protein